MKIIIVTSFLPVSAEDKVPTFVKDQAEHMKQIQPQLDILLHSPHSHHSNTSLQTKCLPYREVRFHYFWPHRLERLAAGKGILSNLKANKLLYLQIPFLILFQFISLFRLSRKEKPDLLYAHWFTPQAISCALVSSLTGIPFIFTTHASDVSILKRIPFAKVLVRWVCKNAKAYTAVSQRTADKLIAFFSENEWKQSYAEKLSILPMGVDTRAPDLDEAYINQVRDQYQLTQHPILLFLGRLAEKKGVKYLLDAVDKLPDDYRSSLQLIIAGEGLLRQELEEYSRKIRLPNVIFTGFVHGNEKNTLLKLADFLCIPSIIDSQGDSEGFPVVLMEGLSEGKVIIGSDVSGIENIVEDRNNGFIVPQKSSDYLAEKIKYCLDLTQIEILEIQNSARKLAKNYDWANIASSHLNILHAACMEK